MMICDYSTRQYKRERRLTQVAVVSLRLASALASLDVICCSSNFVFSFDFSETWFTCAIRLDALAITSSAR